MDKPVIESVAKALLINNQNEVLVLTIGEHKNKPERSFTPDFPGGLVDPGENEYEAVAREINEETGISISERQLKMVYSDTQFYAEENTSVSKHLFIANLPDKPDVTISWEHSSYEWVSLKNLENNELRPFYSEAIQYCFSNEILKKTF